MVFKSNNKLLILGLIFLVALCSGHAFQTITPDLVQLVIPFAGVFVILEMVKRKNWLVGKEEIALLLFCAMIVLTWITCLGSGSYVYTQMLCMVVIGYGITRLYSFRQTANCYLWIMTFVTVIAIVGYVLVQNTRVLNVLPLMDNLNGEEYRTGIIFNYLTHVPERNCGMFWEPGLFATHLIVAMVFEIMLKNKPSVLRLILFSVGIFTANSTAGFALWFLCIALLVVKKASHKSIFSLVLGMVAVIAVIVVAVNFDQILESTSLGDNEYLQKLSTESLTDATRVKAFAHNLESFLSAPLFGVGITEAMENLRYVADTSTSTYMLSVFGVLGVFYTVYWVYGVLKLPQINAFAKIVLLAIVLSILNKEPHHQFIWTWCMLFYLIKGDFAPKTSTGETEERKLSGEKAGMTL